MVVNQRTALEIAIYQHNRTIMKLLLDAHADPNNSNGSKYPCQWVDPARDDAVELTKLLVEYGCKITNPNMGLLHIASRARNIALIKYLIEQGADPNALCANQTPMVWAATESLESTMSSDPLPTMKFLKEHGAKDDIIDIMNKYSK